MNDSQQVREAMWDLVYGLLSSEESQALVARIKSDPQAARMYADVRLQADLVGQAARIEDSSLTLMAREMGGPTPVAQGDATALASSLARAKVQRPSHRAAAWIAGIATTALIGLLVVGFGWPAPNERLLANRYLAADIISQRSLPAGLTNELKVRTYFVSANNATEGTSANVDLKLVDRSGVERLHQALQTSATGEAIVAIPGSAIEPGVRLELSALRRASADWNDAHVEQAPPGDVVTTGRVKALVEAELPVKPEPQVEYFFVADPTVPADKQVPFSLWKFNAFSATPALPEEPPAALEGMDGIVADSVSADNRQGMINGLLQAKDNVQRQAVQDLSYNQLDRRQTANAASGLRNRAAARSAAPLGGYAPAQYKTQQEAALAAQNVELKVAQASKPAERELQKNQATRLAVPSPPERNLGRDVADNDAAGAVADRSEAAKKIKALAEIRQNQEQHATDESALSKATSVPEVPAGQPIALSVPAELMGKSWLAAVLCRGVTVATAESVESKVLGSASQVKTAPAGEKPTSGDKLPRDKSLSIEEQSLSSAARSAGRELSITVPPEADGLLEIVFFDRSTSSAEPVTRQIIYRQPLRKLQIELPDAKPRFAPGENVALTLQVVDERGRPAPNTRLGVRVWNEQLVRQAAEPPVLLADAVQNNFSELAVDAAAAQAAVVDAAKLANPTAGAALAEKTLEDHSLPLADKTTADTKKDDQKEYQLRNKMAGESNSELTESLDHYRRVENSAGLGLEEAAVASAAGPIQLATNRDEVQAAIWQATLEARAVRQRAIHALGVIALLAGGSVLAVLGTLAVLRMSAPIRFTAPAVVAAVASMAVGLTWTGWLPKAELDRVAATRGAFGAKASANAEGGDGKGGYPIKSQPAPAPALASSPEAAALIDTPSLARSQAGNEPMAAGVAGPSAALGAEGGSGRRFAGGGVGGPASGTTPLSRGISAAADAPARTESQDRGEATPGGAPAVASPTAPVGPGAVPALAGRKDGSSAPPSLYFNPQLVTDAEGKATVRFVMPPVESEYRLLIDALGQGRIGSRQQVISAEKQSP